MGRSTTIRFFGFGLVALSLGAVACAAGDDGEGGGGNSGTGGLVNGATGGVTGATGGVTGATGGVTGATGGVTGATGGTTGATGGTTGAPVECPAAGASFVEDAYASNGTMCGYMWTTAWDEATVEPACPAAGGDCFTGTTACATGNVPAAVAPVYPGLGVGWNVQQAADGAEQAWSPTGSGVTIHFTTTNAVQVRAGIRIGSTDYCADLPANGPATLAWTDFNTACWDGSGTALAQPFSAITVQATSVEDEAQNNVEICVTNIEFNP